MDFIFPTGRPRRAGSLARIQLRIGYGGNPDRRPARGGAVGPVSATSLGGQWPISSTALRGFACVLLASGAVADSGCTDIDRGCLAVGGLALYRHGRDWSGWKRG